MTHCIHLLDSRYGRSTFGVSPYRLPSMVHGWLSGLSIRRLAMAASAGIGVKLVVLLLLVIIGWIIGAPALADDTLRPYAKNPYYWQYDGEPVLLVGGSVDDNLFQLPELEAHLDAIQQAEGNYIRNTMSDRPDAGHEIYAYHRRDDGRYDLERWNPEYWERFENMLQWTAERQIFVQIEVWDRFDYSRDNWPPHPYNPSNNVNYTHEESGLAKRYPEHPGRNQQPFFFTTPEQENNTVLLKYQQRFVDKMLSYALEHDHVLYCIDNETSGEDAWATYWAQYLRHRADKAGVEICITQMWDQWNLRADEHRRTLDHPERYDFVDVSQNNHQKGQQHWDNFQWVRDYIQDSPRPINTVKTYGADGNKFGHLDQDGIERFFRHLIGGAASARFHRPDSGLGLSEAAISAIRSIRAVESKVKLWNLEPANQLLSKRSENEAYVAADPGRAYVVYFTDGGHVELDLNAADGDESELSWLRIDAGEWTESRRIQGSETVSLEAPGSGGWLAVLCK